jgi:hypothetical protein
MQLGQDTADSADKERQKKRWKCSNESSTGTGIKNLNTRTGKLTRSIKKN